MPKKKPEPKYLRGMKLKVNPFMGSTPPIVVTYLAPYGASGGAKVSMPGGSTAILGRVAMDRAEIVKE